MAAKKKASSKKTNNCNCADNKVMLRLGSFFMMGMGGGILLTNPMINPHPLRYGVAIVGIGLVSYLVSRAE